MPHSNVDCRQVSVTAEVIDLLHFAALSHGKFDQGDRS